MASSQLSIYNKNESKFINHLDNFISSNNTTKKELILCIGPMFSGKTTLLYKTYEHINRFNSINSDNNDNNDNNDNIRVFILNSSIDIRIKSNFISSHNKDINGRLSCIKTNSIYNDFISPYLLNDIQKNTRRRIILLIDECQFYDDLFHSINYIFKNIRDTPIFIGCFGLNGDFNANTIGETHKLIPLSKDIIVLHSVCSKCKKYALFSHNIYNTNNNNIDIISVGGDETYIPLCNDCFF